MRFVFWMLSLLGALPGMEIGRWDCRLANAFEVSSRYNPSKRISVSANEQHGSGSNIEERSSKPQHSPYKYDLGLGKNQPLQAKDQGDSIMRQQVKDQERIYRATTDVTAFDNYEACRFLIEHEATRIYPAPTEGKTADSNESQGESLANRHSATMSSKTTSVKVILRSASNGKQKSNPHAIALTKEKSEATSTTLSVKSASATSGKSNRQKHLAKVQPKRLLEDCFMIFDHEKSESAASASSAKSTIWSRPNTPQLDMNSVWVEMLLHNQMAISQSKG